MEQEDKDAWRAKAKIQLERLNSMMSKRQIAAPAEYSYDDCRMLSPKRATEERATK